MYKRYYSCYDMDMGEVKKELISMCRSEGLNDLEAIIIHALDCQDIKRYLSRHQQERMKVFIYLKQVIDHQQSMTGCEKYVVMMKQLMPWQDMYFTAYRKSLKHQIFNASKQVLCASHYCVLRHLFKTRRESLRYLKTLDTSNSNQVYHLCLMYLMEEMYSEVYPLIQTIDYTGELCEYDYILQCYSPCKYRRYIEKSSSWLLGGWTRWTNKRLEF